MEDITIIRKDPVGEVYPRFFYKTVRDGQGEYVRKTCKEKGIKAIAMNKEVAIYSKKKLPAFVSVIRNSLELAETPQPEMRAGTLLCKEGAKILAFFIMKEDGVHLYVTEKRFPEVKCFIFERKLPRYYFCHLFNSHKEFKHHVQEVEHYIL